MNSASQIAALKFVSGVEKRVKAEVVEELLKLWYRQFGRFSWSIL